MSDSTVPVNATRGCDHLPCPAPARRLIHWRNASGEAGRTWACEEHVEELRQEAVDAGCTVIGPILPPRLPAHIAGRPPSLALVLSDHDGAPLGRWVYPPGAGCWVAEDGGLLSLDEVENEVRTLIRRTPDVG